VLRTTALLLLGLWLGAIVFFALGVAGHAFEVLTPVPGGRVLAAQIVGRSLTSLNLFGIGCGVAFIVLSSLQHRSVALKRNIAVFAMLLLTLFGQYWIAPRIERVRNAVTQTTIYDLPETDARRVYFTRLHMASRVTAISALFLGIMTFCGVVLFERQDTM
jgi:hypothetical protein